VQALSRAISVKTSVRKNRELAQAGERDQFVESSQLAAEAAGTAYYQLLSTLSSHMVSGVSSKFTLEKDTAVTKLERQFDGEQDLAYHIKNVAGILAKRLFAKNQNATSRTFVPPTLHRAPLGEVERATPHESIRVTVPIDQGIRFDVPATPIGETGSILQYPDVEDIPDDERVSFPKIKSIGNITEADISKVVRPVSNPPVAITPSFQESSVTPTAPERAPLVALDLPKIYQYLDHFPGGRDALSDDVKEWIYQAEGLFGSRPHVLGRSFFTQAQLATPYDALKGKTVREILTLQKSKSGFAHALALLHLTPAAFAVWADRLAQFELHHPDINISMLSLEEAVEILFAVDKIGGVGRRKNL
jgi:hypothetical protein